MQCNMKYSAFNVLTYNKTKWMIQSRNTTSINQQTESDRFQTITDFKYLRVVITNDNKGCTEIQTRITVANKTYFALLDIMKSRCVHRKTKFQIYKTVIRSVLCYGYETWVMNNRMELALGVFERKIMRRIIGPVKENGQWRIRYNQELME